jgi:hypothetical protein
VDFITDLNNTVKDLPKAVSWTVLASKLRLLHAAAADSGLAVETQNTANGWLITFRDREKEVARWRMSSSSDAIHEWPVEAFSRQISLLGAGYQNASTQDLAAAWNDLAS